MSKCKGYRISKLDYRLKDLYQYETLCFKLFQILNNPKFKGTCLWNEVYSNMVGIRLFNEYLDKEKQFLKINSFYEELLNEEDTDENKMRDSDLMFINIEYGSLIVKLDGELNKSRIQYEKLD